MSRERRERLARLWHKVDVFLFDLNAAHWRDLPERLNRRRIRWEGLRHRLGELLRREGIRDRLDEQITKAERDVEINAPCNRRHREILDTLVACRAQYE